MAKVYDGSDMFITTQFENALIFDRPINMCCSPVEPENIGELFPGGCIIVFNPDEFHPIEKQTYHWHCDNCGWDSEHSDVKHSVHCFAMQPDALKPRPAEKTSQQDYEKLFGAS